MRLDETIPANESAPGDHDGLLPRLKSRLAALLPHPDPAFDPLTGAVRVPRVREIALDVGPAPCGLSDRKQDGSAGLAWG